MAVSQTVESSSVAVDAGESAPEGLERRRSGRRARARDRLMDRGTRPTRTNRRLVGLRNIENLLLFIDDDLRETALAITRVEDFLTLTLSTLESDDLRREHIQALSRDAEVLENLDMLGENLESLRRRLAKLSSAMRR